MPARRAGLACAQALVSRHACTTAGFPCAQIVEYNHAVETYTVDLGGGLLKYGVESGSIAAADFVAQLAGLVRVRVSSP